MNSENSEAIPFSIEISKMIELLAAQIYPSPFALLRENVQNAFDAVMIRRHRGDEFEAAIDVVIEPHRISITDNGVGMSRKELREHFWRAGSSSKNTDDARAAGVVGTFGIGAMANFGIASTLEVTSESGITNERTYCIAKRETLSVTDDCITMRSQEPTGSPGTNVTATTDGGAPINVAEALTYIAEFVPFVRLPVRVNGEILSEKPIEDAVAELATSWEWSGERVMLGNQLVADVSLTGSGSGEVRVDVRNISLDGVALPGLMVLRQGIGGIRTFRNRFGLATTSIPSSYQLGGVADFMLLQPTAGREALTTDSVAFLNLFAAPLDTIISEHLAAQPEANVSSNFVNWAAAHQRWDLCGELRAYVRPGDSRRLEDLANVSQEKPLLVYSGTDPGTMEHASAERPLVQLSRNNQRRLCELGYLNRFARVEMMDDEPKVLERCDVRELSLAQSGLAFRLTEILSSDYFLSTEVGFGKISHGLPLLVCGTGPVSITLDPAASNVTVMLEIYEREFGAFAHMAKDFVRSVIFPRISHLVPSATRQGTEAFLKSLQRTRDIFEYERSDLESLTSLWNDYMEGRISMEQAAVRVSAVQRSHQFISPESMGHVREVVPDVAEGEQLAGSGGTEYGAMPAIQRTDMSTDRKLLVIDEPDPPLKGFRLFLAISKRIREERGEFFMQPHRTSVVWGGQKALFIFEHQSGEVGLYYDVQMREPVAQSSGGGSFETATIVMKNQVFIPVPPILQQSFMPVSGETKRLEVRCDLLYIDNR